MKQGTKTHKRICYKSKRKPAELMVAMRDSERKRERFPNCFREMFRRHTDN